MGEVAINPTIEPPKLTQDWGNRLLGGHKQNLVHTRTQEKGAVTPQETNPDLPIRVQESPVENMGQRWPAAGLGTLSAAVHARDLLKEVAIIFITSTIVLPQVNNRGNTAPPINRKLD